MAAPAKLLTMSQGFQDPKGTAVASGTLMLTLSQSCTVTATGGIVDTMPIYLALDANGKIANTAVWFSDELSPSGTVYRGVVYGKNGLSIINGLDRLSYSFTGAGPFDLSTAVQSATASPSYSGAVLLTPTANQAITQNNLLPGTDNSQSLGSAVKRWIGQFAALTALTLNKITFTQPATAATLTLTNNSTLTGQGTGTIVNRDSTDPLTNKTFTGAASGNAVTLLNSQDALGAVTGNGTDLTLYTYTIPANTIQAGKGIRIRAGALSNNAVSCTFKLILGSTTLATWTPTAANVQNVLWELFNNSGVQNAQTSLGMVFDSATLTLSAAGNASTENFANALILKLTANEVAANTVTPKKWFVELIQ